ncbi:TPA: hypothetical protein ACGO1T_001715 [Streptococcus suis]
MGNIGVFSLKKLGLSDLNLTQQAFYAIITLTYPIKVDEVDK